MVETITLNPTSNCTADGQDIVLRKNQKTRLIFRPMIVDNSNDQEASVRGTFIFQRKSRKDDWEDHNKLKLNNLRASEWVKLKLKSAELLNFSKSIQKYYKIYDEFGIQHKKKDFIITDNNYSSVVRELINEEDYLEKLSKNNKYDLLIESIKWIAETDDYEEVIKKLKELELNDLEQINSIVGIINLRKVLDMWKKNKKNSSEKFWQKTLKNNSWIINRIFASPMVVFEDEAYMGGKGLNNSGGKVIDFIYKNNLTENVVLIEIKTPTTNLIGKEYRNQVFSTHNELSGAINQLLSYKDSLQKQYNSISNNSQEKFNVFSPKCIVIAGCLENMDKNQLASFELYREELKNVEIITFDELFEKVKNLLNLFEEKE